MKHRSVLSCLFLVAVTAIGVFGLAQDSPTEAPAGFDTPTLAQNPGSQSKSNGITNPPATPSLSTNKSTKQPMMPAWDWALSTTPGLAPSAIRIRSAEGPANLPNCVSAIWTPMAIS
jgi:hypothetical protein